MALTTEALQKRTADMEHGLDANRLTPEMLAYQMPVLGNVVSLAQMQEALLPVAEEDSQNHFGADAFTDFDSGSIKDTSASYFGGMSAEDEEEEEKKRQEDLEAGLERAAEINYILDNTEMTIGGRTATARVFRDDAKHFLQNKEAVLENLRRSDPAAYARYMQNEQHYDSEVRKALEAANRGDVETMGKHLSDPTVAKMLESSNEVRSVGMNNNPENARSVNIEMSNERSHLQAALPQNNQFSL